MEEGTLIRRAADGDRHAFGILVRSHQEALHRWIDRLVRDDDTARDLTQETFLRAFRGLPAFRGDAAFGTWIRTIATNVVRSHARAAPAARFVALEPDVADPGPAPDAELEHASQRRALERALERLPPRQREVVTLRIYQELSYAEIARRTGSSENACKVNFHYAVKRLRALLTAPGTAAGSPDRAVVDVPPVDADVGEPSGVGRHPRPPRSATAIE